MQAQKDSAAGVFRHEVKYYLDERQAFVLAQFLARVMRADSHAGADGQYWIRSLYFDTPGNRDYYDKVNGCCQRKKIRLRIYDTAAATATLEMKSKRGEFVHKQGLPLRKADARRLIDGDYTFLPGMQSAAADPFFVCFRREHRRPVVLVDYKRQAFELPFENIRVTIDRDVRASTHAQGLFEQRVPGVTVLDGRRCILEVKYRRAIPDFIRGILSDIGPPKESISKYVMCRQAIGF
ncbi:MAG: polyphosphate polymerase domain-containing protein [Eubacteriales bacterium]|nr:polyphosphate polymerase domain-containing protein [Eubacteriales bacterium]